MSAIASCYGCRTATRCGTLTGMTGQVAGRNLTKGVRPRTFPGNWLSWHGELLVREALVNAAVHADYRPVGRSGWRDPKRRCVAAKA